MDIAVSPRQFLISLRVRVLDQMGLPGIMIAYEHLFCRLPKQVMSMVKQYVWLTDSGLDSGTLQLLWPRTATGRASYPWRASRPFAQV